MFSNGFFQLLLMLSSRYTKDTKFQGENEGQKIEITIVLKKVNNSKLAIMFLFSYEKKKTNHAILINFFP